MRAKEAVRELLDRLPDDCTLDDVLYHLYVVQQVEEGLEAAREGRVLPHEQVMRELREEMAERRRVVWTWPAALLLFETITSLAQHSPHAAARFQREVDAAARSLESLADRGRFVPELLGTGAREIFVRRRLMYLVRHGEVWILAFLHGARDLGWTFGAPTDAASRRPAWASRTQSSPCSNAYPTTAASTT